MEIFATLVGGIAVGLVVLAIEYGYFQKRRSGGAALPETSKAPELPPAAPEPLRDAPTHDAGTSKPELPWPDAINKALMSFSAMHPRKRVELIRTDASAGSAELLVIVWEGSGMLLRSTGYSLRIDKAGEILTIRQNPST